MKAVIVIAIVTAAAACSGEGGEPVDCSAAGPASAELGGGTQGTGFIPLSDGSAMTLVLGPQGLYMVTPSVRVRGMYPGVAGRLNHDSDPEIVIEARLDGALIGGSAREHIGMVEVGDAAETTGVFVPFDVDRAEYLGELVTLELEVSDACGRSATDALAVEVIQ